MSWSHQATKVCRATYDIFVSLSLFLIGTIEYDRIKFHRKSSSKSPQNCFFFHSTHPNVKKRIHIEQTLNFEGMKNRLLSGLNTLHRSGKRLRRFNVNKQNKSKYFLAYRLGQNKIENRKLANQFYSPYFQFIQLFKLLSSKNFDNITNTCVFSKKFLFSVIISSVKRSLKDRNKRKKEQENIFYLMNALQP